MNTAEIKPPLYPARQRICVDRANLAKQIGSVKPGFRRHRLATQIPRRGDHSRDRKYLIQLSIRLAGGLGFEPRLAESESAVLPLDDPPPGARWAGKLATIRLYITSSRLG